VVDASGAYLIPGLWDMHAHAAREDRVESFFRLFLANGITGFRDMWGSLDVAAHARARVQTGELPGPTRFVVAGNLVDGPVGTWPGSLTARTPEDGRRLVDSLHAAGAPFIKVYHGLLPETYFAIAARARELDIPFAGHVPFLVRAADAAAAGQRSNEHLFGVLEGCSADEEAILAEFARSMAAASEARDMATLAGIGLERVRRAVASQDDDVCRHLAQRFIDNETWQVPTLVSLRGKVYPRELAAAGDPRMRYFTPPQDWAPGRFGTMTADQEAIVRANAERSTQIIGLMAASGVPFLAGTDAPVTWAFPGFGIHDELALLVEAGLTPLQALQAATLNPAWFLGRTAELGTVAEGRLADLVLLDANPLEDITNTTRIRAVIADGRLYRRTDLDGLLAEAEALNRGVRESRSEHAAGEVDMTASRIVLSVALLAAPVAAIVTSPDSSADIGATQEQILRGRLAVTSRGCADCHGGGNPAGAGYLAGRAGDEDAFPIGEYRTWARNLTPDDRTGLGRFSERQIFNSLRYGLRPGETPDVDITSTTPGEGNFPLHPKYLAPPMPWPYFRHMPDEELWAIAAYLKRAVRPVGNRVPDSEGPPDFWAGAYTEERIGPFPLPSFPTAYERIPD
jgi:mono/diheme cytochrome c family protein